MLATHRAAGIDIVLGATAGGFEVEGDRLASLQVNGAQQPVDLLLLGIGAVPETALAQAAGIECADGIVVDEHMPHQRGRRARGRRLHALSRPARGPRACSSSRCRTPTTRRAPRSPP